LEIKKADPQKESAWSLTHQSSLPPEADYKTRQVSWLIDHLIIYLPGNHSSGF